ncbi:MAG: glutamate synthase large subunit, partial [Ostreibacterium sp.]
MLYHPSQAKSSCGFGLIAQMDNQASHDLIQKAIAALTRLTHRGAVAADGLTGDGCGILMKIPDEFMQNVTKSQDIHLAENYAVGMFFIPDTSETTRCIDVIEKRIQQNGLTVAGWRDVPINPEHLGQQAKLSLPLIKQIFVNATPQMDVHSFDRALFIARHQMRDELQNQEGFYNCSLSSQTVIYKGLMMSEKLTDFYLDLANPSIKSSLIIFHQRFSTNTAPKWKLAQPFRLLAHNGEINTINANRSWALARIAKTIGERFPELMGMHTLVNQSGSDSSSLDNMLDLLISGGIDLKRAMRLLVPPAWQNVDHLHPDLRAFYEYNSMHMEPWDGPAGIVLTDGRYAGCSLDRNGLRPARYIISKNRELLIASENGTCDIPENEVIEKGRLRAGELMLLDLQTGQLLKPQQIDEELMNRAPYSRWLSQSRTRLRSVFQQDVPVSDNLTSDEISHFEHEFELSFEERNQVIRSMIEEGQESIGSMGDDTPIAVLSQKTRPLSDYFRQLFAQVTNPPIDSLRESMVMSLQTCLGSEHSMFREGESQATRVVIDSPILSEGEFLALLQLDKTYPSATLALHYNIDSDLETALDNLCKQAYHAIQQGAVLLILDDKDLSSKTIPIHALLATGTLHEYLINKDLRGFANIVVKTATARDPHHMACLLGAGATLIYPYLAHEVIAQMLRFEQSPSVSPNQALCNYRKAIDKGLYKIMSKMGISTITSYRGSQLFETLGLSASIRDKAFSNMASRIGGISFTDLHNEQLIRHQRAFDNRSQVPIGGILKYMRNGEYHAYNPEAVQYLQVATKSGHYDDYKKYRDVVNKRQPAMLRDLLDFTDTIAVDKNDIEPMQAILKRFDSAAMSLGALSPEAHETLAEAMNELGGRSNSGEGGEDAKRFGTTKVSKIKQIASGRFGVTAHYLVNAEVLQIKIAQGAKPGEGGQLPGHKSNEMIATLRYSKPGVTLISPPPHHDIYSIEDLAQLIHDLKQVNPDALISVKLVSAPGVGTIANGVAKCYADMVTISGHDGGTGASPQTSIRYAGSPWEL